MLDEQAAQILATTDAVAERVRKIGGTTLRSIGDIARRQRIKDNDARFVSASDMLAELRQDNLALVEALREAKTLVDEAGDNGTSGILDDWTDEAERRAWFLFETAGTVASRHSWRCRPAAADHSRSAGSGPGRLSGLARMYQRYKRTAEAKDRSR